MNEACFDTIFPSILGHSKIIDDFLSNPRAEYHQTCVLEKIVFDDANDKDRDWEIKHCYTLIIADAGKLECNIDNLWTKGLTQGRREYPEFG
eukprot:8089638-Ditylum_brightwellii.AAC.1